MPRNVHTVERGIRIVLGLFVLSLTFLVPTWWGLLGAVPLATGLVGYCPLYRVFGVSTCSRRTPPPGRPAEGRP